MENETKNYEQANVYINAICNLYNVSDKQREKMYDGLEQIQQELEGYDPYDVKVAINKHYKYKSSKTRPNLHQVVAELTGAEKNDYYTDINCLSAYERFEDLVEKSLNEYLNSENRLEILKSLGYDTKKPTVQKIKNMNYAEIKMLFANKIDEFMCQYIQIQANILSGAKIGVGLDGEFSRIKPTAHQQSSKYSCLLSYFRSKEFYETVKKLGTISILIPNDIQEHFFNKGK